ncbi:hypothetical protein CLAFUW4_04323 [Fulvia fulva]|uniref:Major facilitator superfamily (MFS) profile domain-containing protein n=1 Tax=Passalora fulva TaxID=5499 RepID=A0A9Q8LHR4_PASFU|nr:uncharacterized protein CLAFUR5_04287 [Fulvia fulva]KAK4626458.1 hypothetical protein CLAFUR4_04309 [Fulvia fulva]KAK4627490.1 hypothetical protein CLAFUR0_04311 [Fulvia fulva]UJO16853.1 hypothetical protein CLAFUR5_04287 [Fulvia fulva]WPV13845.1 hypothetical protein CLAFUW4_04323 [Fulvia fulva]WPV28907.1 hypothetical protein CLAFUW7_04312 [Fulvia fulva]
MFAWFWGSDTRPPVLLKLRSSKTFIIIVVASAIFTDIFAYGIVVPVFPFALTERAGIDQSDIQSWTSIFLAVYGAALLVASPIFGWLADRMKSRQIPFMIGLLLLGASTAMLTVGDSIGLLAAGRVLQGASAAVVWVVGLALLVDTIGPDDIGSAMGYVGLSMSLAILLAPLLGGVVFQYAGYYQVYAMAFGLIVLDIILRFAMIEKKNTRQWLPEQSPSAEEALESREDRASAEIEKQAPKDGATHAVDDVGQEVSEQPAIERKASHAPSHATSLIPERAPGFVKAVVARLPPVVFLFGSRRVLCALWACVIQSSLMTSFDSTLPLFVRDTFHWDSTGAGLVFLPIVVASFIGPFIGRLSDKYGPRWFATAGFALCCPFLILLRLVTHDSMGQKVLLCALLAIIGFGLTLALTPIMAEIAYAVEAKAQRHPPGFFGKNGAFAQAYGLFNMAWAAGAMIGPLLAGFVVDSQGWPTATLILGCISIFTAVPTAIWTGGSIFKERKREQQDAQNSAIESG